MSANGMLVDEELKDFEDQKLIPDELLDTTVFRPYKLSTETILDREQRYGKHGQNFVLSSTANAPSSFFFYQVYCHPKSLLNHKHPKPNRTMFLQSQILSSYASSFPSLSFLFLSSLRVFLGQDLVL
jgi:hypothetical protein